MTMKTQTKIAGIIFLLLSIADVVCLALGDEATPMYIKPFLMPSLAAAALMQLLPENKGRMPILLAIGLTFHTAGDILLMFDGFTCFAAGLGSFLIGHFFYLAILLSGMGGLKGWKEILCLLVPMVLAPVLVMLFGVEWPFSAVVTVYAFTLMIVAASGVLWALRGKAFAIRIIVGGIIFIISDSLIAIDSFAGIDFPFRHALVMLTYVTAEWLLVSGMVRERISGTRPRP
jgi:uncharacterized membrane protein YhhN